MTRPIFRELRSQFASTRFFLVDLLRTAGAERSLEEVVSVFVAALHGELPRQDGMPLRFLPRACCKQPRVKADVEALVA